MLTVSADDGNGVADQFADEVLFIVELFVVLYLPQNLFDCLVSIIYDLICKISEKIPSVTRMLMILQRDSTVFYKF